MLGFEPKKEGGWLDLNPDFVQHSNPLDLKARHPQPFTLVG